MSAMSDYLESGVNNYLFRGSSFSPPTNISIALTSGVPQSSDTGATIPEFPTHVEVSGEMVPTGYNRVNYATPSQNGATKFNHVYGSGLVRNNEQIVFSTILRDLGPCSGIAVLDSPHVGSGNLLLYSELTHARELFEGDSPKFDANKFEIELS